MAGKEKPAKPAARTREEKAREEQERQQQNRQDERQAAAVRIAGYHNPRQ